MKNEDKVAQCMLMVDGASRALDLQIVNREYLDNPLQAKTALGDLVVGLPGWEQQPLGLECLGEACCLNLSG